MDNKVEREEPLLRNGVPYVTSVVEKVKVNPNDGILGPALAKMKGTTVINKK